MTSPFCGIWILTTARARPRAITEIGDILTSCMTWRWLPWQQSLLHSFIGRERIPYIFAIRSWYSICRLINAYSLFCFLTTFNCRQMKTSQMYVTCKNLIVPMTSVGLLFWTRGENMHNSKLPAWFSHQTFNFTFTGTMPSLRVSWKSRTSEVSWEEILRVQLIQKD